MNETPPSVQRRLRTATVFALATTMTLAGCITSLAQEDALHQEAAPLPELRPFHLRVFEDGVLALSTWPDEQGTIQPQPVHEGAEPMAGTLANYTGVWGPLGTLLAISGDSDSLTQRGVLLPAAVPVTRTLPRSLVLSREGEIPEAAALKLMGHKREPGAYRLERAIPFEIISWDETVRYRMSIDDPLATIKVSRTEGLGLRISPVGDDKIAFSFHFEGFFESFGCEPVPGTLVPPGYYVLRESDEDSLHFDVYSDSAYYYLQQKRVDLEIVFVSKEEITQ